MTTPKGFEISEGKVEKISPHWTSEERLEVIHLITLHSPITLSPFIMKRHMDIVEMIAHAPARFLEEHRMRIYGVFEVKKEVGE